MLLLFDILEVLGGVFGHFAGDAEEMFGMGRTVVEVREGGDFSGEEGTLVEAVLEFLHAFIATMDYTSDQRTPIIILM